MSLRFWRSLIFFAAALAAIGCSKTAEEHLASADVYLGESDPRAALIELKNAVAKSPTLAAARSRLGQLHLTFADYPSALKELERAIDLGLSDDVTTIALLKTKNALGQYRAVIGELEEEDTLTPEYAVVLANAYIAAGDMERAHPLLLQGEHLADGLFGLAKRARLEDDLVGAEAYLTELVVLDPSHRDGWLYRGEVALAQGQDETALNCFSTASVLPGGDLSGHLGRVRSLLHGEKYEQAQSEISALISRADAFTPAHYVSGLISFKTGDLEAASAALRVVQSRDPDHMPTRFLMGIVHSQMDRPFQAIADLRSYLDAEKENLSVRKLIASILFDQENYKEVTEVLSAASEKHSDPQVWAMLGTAYLHLEKAGLATEAFQRAVDLAPDSAPFRNQLALGLLSVGDQDGASSQLDYALEIEESQFQSQYIKALMSLRTGDLEGAAVSAANLTVRNPALPIGHNLQGVIALAQEDEAAARRAFLVALEQDGAYFPAVRNLTQIAINSGDLDDAFRLYKAFAERNPEREEAQLGLIEIAVRRGDTKGALTRLEQVIAAHPNSISARLGFMRLLLSKGMAAQAVIAGKSAQEVMPGVADILLLKAEAERRVGDVRAALQTARRLQGLLANHANNNAMLSEIASLQLRLNNTAQARAAIDLMNTDREIPNFGLLSMARLAAADARFERADELIVLLRERGFEGVELDLLEGDVLARTGRPSEAKQLFKKSRHEGSRRGVLRFAQAALRDGEITEARETLEVWLEEHPGDKGAKILLANIHMRTGQLVQASRIYESILPSSDPVVLNNLAWIYLGEGKSEALGLAREANRIAPKDPTIEATLGRVLVVQDQISEGLQFLRSSARARPKDASVQFYLAIAYLRYGQQDAARSTLERAVVLGDFPQLDYAKRLLATI